MTELAGLDTYQPPTISLNICEPFVGQQKNTPWIVDWPTFDLRSIIDPFGLRRAVFPILEVQEDGSLIGLGSGFALDPWGKVLTAQHVVEKRAASRRRGIVALLSYGLAFGRVKIPDSAFGQIVRTLALSVETDNPLTEITGTNRAYDFDLALGELNDQHDQTLVSNLPIRANIFQSIKPGDHVVALGFPSITFVTGEPDDVGTIIAHDGITAARGIVTEVFPLGRGRSRPTPVFEVECNWPSGMSGGPVFNQRGEVIGLVSSSIDAANGDRAGRGWATWLEAFPAIDRFLPSLDGLNPKCRRCWGGFVGDDLRRTEDLLERPDTLQQIDPTLQWRRVIWWIGTDEYMLE